MTTPATRWLPLGDLDALWLGKVEVGRVAPAGIRSRKPLALFLLDTVPFWKTAKSNAHARELVEAELAAWLAKAGLA